ncbi:hypothetical protein NBRC10513v2_003360 [Rhodotorula toruloides]
MADHAKNIARCKRLIPPLSPELHKGQAGRIGVLGGSRDYSGAPYFASMTTLRLGADLAHVICEAAAGNIIKTYSPDLIVHTDLHKDITEQQIMDSLKAVLPRLHTLVIGPGLGRDPHMQLAAKTAISLARQNDLYVVLDADSLWLVQNEPDVVRGYKRAVLTPNVVEFARLAESCNLDPKSMPDTELAAAISRALSGPTIVQKGREDRITNGQDTLINAVVGSSRRCGGQGDVLSGAVGTFLAWGKNYEEREAKDEQDPIKPHEITLLAAYAASTVTRTASRLTFAKHKRSMQTGEMLGFVGQAFEEVFGTEEVTDQGLLGDGFACYSVAFSPFFPTKLAVAGAANFGLVGNGRLSVVNQDVGAGPAPGMGPGGMGMRVEKGFDTQDGLYDLAWSEIHENQIATGSGDGSVKLWDTMLNDFPIRKWHEHQREVFSVDWSNTQKELFCTSSWDGTIKIWTPDRPASLQTIPAHSACVYSALFSPSQPSLIASCSSDGTLKLWDTRSPLPPSQPSAPGQPALATPQLTIPAHPNAEILDLDFNKYAPHLIATASVDRTVKVHDMRAASSGPPAGAGAGMPYVQPNTTIATLLGHEYAVRRVAWSPHSSALLATGSYDMTSRIWSVAAAGGGGQVGGFSAQGGMGARIERVWDRHTEFVVGVAWSLYEEGLVASCSWDQEVHLWR